MRDGEWDGFGVEESKQEHFVPFALIRQALCKVSHPTGRTVLYYAADGPSNLNRFPNCQSSRSRGLHPVSVYEI